MTHQDWIAAALGPWAGELQAGAILFRMALSVLLAAAIGCERASKRHSAGLRTFVVVCLSGTAAGLCQLYLAQLTGASSPILCAAAVLGAALVSGNSIIFSSRNQIKGLTTSAGLWACGLLGVCLGVGLYTAALGLFLMLLGTLTLLRTVENRLQQRSNHFEIHLELSSRNRLQDFMATVRRLGLQIDDIESNPAYLNSGLGVYTVALTIRSRELRRIQGHGDLVQALQTLDYINYVEEIA